METLDMTQAGPDLLAALALMLKPAPLYLTPEEVRELGGGYHYPQKQAEVLTERGFPFYRQPATGALLVLRADVERGRQAANPAASAGEAPVVKPKLRKVG